MCSPHYHPCCVRALICTQCLLYPPCSFIPLHSPHTRSCLFILSLVLVYTHLHFFRPPTLPSYLAAIVVAATAAAAHTHSLSLILWFMCTHPVLALCSISGTSAPPLTCNSIISILLLTFVLNTYKTKPYCTCTCGGGESESKDVHMALHNHIWLCHTVT